MPDHKIGAIPGIKGDNELQFLDEGLCTHQECQHTDSGTVIVGTSQAWCNGKGIIKGVQERSESRNL